MKKKTLVSLMCVFLISFILSLNIIATVVELNVTRYSQLSSNWCWVACAQMLANSQVTCTRSQSQAVNYVKNTTTAPNVKGTVTETQIAAEYIAENQITTIKGTQTEYNDNIPLSETAFKNKIKNGYPVIVGVNLLDPSESGRHMVLAYKYGDALGLKIYYYDPVNSSSSVSYDGSFYFDNITSETGTYMISQGAYVTFESYVSILE